MPTLYLTELYAKVHRDTEDCLRVEVPERLAEDKSVANPARVEFVPLIKVDSVVVLGEVSLTTQALHLLLDRNIEVSFLTAYGKFKGRLSPPLGKNSLLRLAQHRAHFEMARRGGLARRFAAGKLANQRSLLLRFQRRLNDPLLEEPLVRLTGVLNRLQDVRLVQPTALPGPRLASGDLAVAGGPVPTVLGLEGAGSAAYFAGLTRLVRDAEVWLFQRRVSRPATDPVNALLSFGYALLANHVESAVQIVGFDPYIGYLHSSVYGRPALALDLMEEFRPVLVDALVLGLLNRREFKPEDFVLEAEGCRLKPEPRKLFLRKFEERLRQEVVHPFSQTRAMYLRCLELQARQLAQFLMDETDNYTPFNYR